MINQSDLEELGDLIDDSARWAVVTALRGPDGPYNALKLLFTAYIRHFVLPKDDKLYWIAADVRTKSLDLGLIELAWRDARNWANKDVKGFSHYITHVEMALKAIDVEDKERELLHRVAECISGTAWLTRDADLGAAMARVIDKAFQGLKESYRDWC